MVLDRSEIRKILIHTGLSLVLLYFFYYLFQGERSVFVLYRFKKEIELDSKQLQSLKEVENQLAHRVHLLRPDHLDQDLLEERVYHILHLIPEGSYVLRSSHSLKEPVKKPN